MAKQMLGEEFPCSGCGRPVVRKTHNHQYCTGCRDQKVRNLDKLKKRRKRQREKGIEVIDYRDLTPEQLYNRIIHSYPELRPEDHSRKPDTSKDLEDWIDDE